MKFYTFPETKGWKITFCVFFTLMFLLSRDTLLALNQVGFVRSQLITFFMFLAAGAVFLWVQRRNIREILTDPRMGLALLSIVLMVVPVLVKRDFQTMYFSILFYILASVFLSYFLRVEQMAKAYAVLLSVLAVYSVLCTYPLRAMLEKGLISVPAYYNDQWVQFYNFGLAHITVDFVTNRNFGIFREPGVYQFFILLGLFLNNYYICWDRPWKYWIVNVILAVTMLTTFATGGVLELILLAAFLFFDKKWYKKRRARILAYLACLAVAGAAAYIVITENGLYVDLIGMLTKFTDEDSGLTRINAVLIDLGIFLHHPLFGERMETVLHVVESNSTSTMVLFASLGFLGGCLHVAAWAAFAWDGKRNIFANLFLLLILFMSFNTQNLSWNILFWAFPMMALCQKGLPLLEKVREKHHGS